MASKVSDQTINEIVDFVNAKIDIPYIPEVVEEYLFRALITLLLSLGEEGAKNK